MATAREKAPTHVGHAPADAAASLQKLRNTVVRVTVSDPDNRARTLAEFELPVSDSFASALDSYLKAKPASREPNARLAAALDEAGHIEPRFKSAQELFDALEKEGRG